MQRNRQGLKKKEREFKQKQKASNLLGQVKTLVESIGGLRQGLIQCMIVCEAVKTKGLITPEDLSNAYHGLFRQEEPVAEESVAEESNDV